MPDTVMIGARVRRDDAEAFREQAQRHGLTTSRALEALVTGALAVEERADSDTSTKETTA